MRAMILAAGRGERMLPLTRHTPKPLLQVGGRPLLEHHILNLKAGGFGQLVINAAYLAGQIIEFCGDGSRWGVHIEVSEEEEPWKPPVASSGRYPSWGWSFCCGKWRYLVRLPFRQSGPSCPRSRGRPSGYGGQSRPQPRG